jgi:hypothetical protein
VTALGRSINVPDMKPFPGMDPYLERHWEDVHGRLIVYACDTLLPHLPDDLLARIEERVYVESYGARIRPIAPDVRLVTAYPAPGDSASGRYHKLDYRIDLDPPILTEDATRATDLLQAAGKR